MARQGTRRNPVIHWAMQMWHEARTCVPIRMRSVVDFPRLTIHAGKPEEPIMRSLRLRLGVGLLGLAAFGFTIARPADALQINAVYDSSVTSRSDFAQIKSAFSQAGDAWSNVLSDNVTVNCEPPPAT